MIQMSCNPIRILRIETSLNFKITRVKSKNYRRNCGDEKQILIHQVATLRKVGRKLMEVGESESGV